MLLVLHVHAMLAILSWFAEMSANQCRAPGSAEWVARLRDTVVDSFEHPTFWDKMYTTGLAAFFCAQKTVMLPMTSRCGQNMVSTGCWLLYWSVCC